MWRRRRPCRVVWWLFERAASVKGRLLAAEAGWPLLTRLPPEPSAETDRRTGSGSRIHNSPMPPPLMSGVVTSGGLSEKVVGSLRPRAHLRGHRLAANPARDNLVY